MYSPIKNGFNRELAKLERLDLKALLSACGAGEARAALGRARLRPEDFLALLSPAAETLLEETALRARDETLRHFGRSVQLFTPLYLANHCTNRCVYCGFSARRDIARRMLGPDEVAVEAEAIAATGLRKVLALTGDAPALTGPAYLAECLKALSGRFSSVGIEVPSMTVDEYAMQVEAGADSMTMFQETYDRVAYARLHPAGPKRDFAFRLDAPERALAGGMRSVNLGPLLGLGDWRADVFTVGMHAGYLQDKYPEAEISISLPRMRPHTGGGEAAFTPETVSDPHFVQALIALRVFLPQAGITMSSREPAGFRDKLIPLGVTRVSAGVCTAVGGHSAAGSRDKRREDGEKPQFDISDNRSVEEMEADILKLGYQPVFADWLLQGRGDAELSRGLREALGGRVGPEPGGAVPC